MQPFIQVAFGGDWAHALSSRSAGGLERLLERLRADDGEVAIEIFFPALIERPLLAPFLGVRFSGETRSGVANLIQRLDATVTTPRAAVEVLRSSVDARLYSRPPVRAELGVVNDWRATARTIERWDDGEWIDRLAESAPRLLERTAAPVALESAADWPIAHWWAVPVSVAVTDGYRLDPVVLEQAMRRVASMDPVDALSDPR